MILLADSEGPDQIARIAQAYLGLHCPHMPEDTFLQCKLLIITLDNPL